MERFGRRSFLNAATAVSAACLCGASDLFAQNLVGRSGSLSNFPLLTQPDDISCGPTCAAMVLQWYGINAGIQRCKTKAGTRWFQLGGYKVGMTLPSGVSDCLNAFGVPASVVRGSVNDVKRYIDQGRPPILLVRSSVKTWHWVTAIAYYDDGARIKLSDPSGQQWVINNGALNGAWTFSTDMSGNATGGRRCDPCGGSGKLASARVTCANCAGTGKMVSNFQVKKCGKCGGAGKINVSGGKCLVCSGSGKSPDFYRKVVESANVSGHTLVVPDRGRRIVEKVEYTIRNDSGRTVRFQMQPSGKSYALEAGRTFSGTSHEVNGKPPTITISDTGKTYKLTAGKHKFWWMRGEQRIGFDRNIN